MTIVNEAIERLKEMGEQHVAVAIWCEDDVLGRAKELGIKITREQAAMIIDHIDNHEDCDLGITWETIDGTLTLDNGAIKQETAISPIKGRRNDLPRKVGLAKEDI